jgi:hypothetical protein
MWHIWGRGLVHTGFWCWNLRETGNLEDIGIEGWTIIKFSFEIQDVRGRTKLLWLRIRTVGRQMIEASVKLMFVTNDTYWYTSSSFHRSNVGG